MTHATQPVPDPWANPMAGNPLRTRADVQRAVNDLVAPIIPHLSPSGARARLGTFGAAFPMRVAELEGFARPLWGIVPLVAGGGSFAHWDRWVSGLDAGTNPDHPDYWGPSSVSFDQRMVEMSAIGFALAYTPEHIWDPLSGAARDRVIHWLRGIERGEPAPNNWQFFRLLVQMGFERVGVEVDTEARTRSHELLESYYRGDGWYADGALNNMDYYVPFAFHTYGLILAASGLGDRSYSQRYLDRAMQFAGDFQHWFAPDGAAFPFGRSLTYRFAIGSFWGALALADTEALPWDQVKGLSLRHLRWWSDRPISDRDGVLSNGFGYHNPRMAESYNSPGSPYWCMKAFGMLAASADHPFWTADEAAPNTDSTITTCVPSGMVLGQDSSQVVALVAQRSIGVLTMEQEAAKYRKFAYSSRFGFSGDSSPPFGEAFTDSMLAVTDAATRERKLREHNVLCEVADGATFARWQPFPDVSVDTMCTGGAPWHLRVQRITTGRAITTVESGFAVAWEPASFGGPVAIDAGGVGVAQAVTPWGASVAVDLSGSRQPSVRPLGPNANAIAPHTIAPALACALEPGTHQLMCAIGASDDASLVAIGLAPTVSAELLERFDAFCAQPDPGPTAGGPNPFAAAIATGQDKK